MKIYLFDLNIVVLVMFFLYVFSKAVLIILIFVVAYKVKQCV